MKKKLLSAIVGVLLASILVTTILFVFIVKYQYEQNDMQRLKGSNKLIINLLKNDNIRDINEFFKEDFKNDGIRITYIDGDGKVLYDSTADIETMENHNDRKEVLEARKKGEGTDIRESKSTGKRQMYYATLFKDGSVIRSAIAIDDITTFQINFTKYYSIAIIFVLVTGVLISVTLSRNIVRPIEELKNTTRAITGGSLDRRVTFITDDEIGELGKTFNIMADKLQYNMNEVTENKNKLEAILKSMDSGVIAVDNRNRVITINPYAEKIFNIKHDIIGLNLMDCIRNYELEKAFLEDDSNDFMEIKLCQNNERILRVKTASIVNEYATIGKVAVLQDITEIKKLENMRSQFVANVSHELKTPLTSIKGFAETLKDVDDRETKEKFLNIINDEAERLSRLINDILTLSVIENSSEPINTLVDLNKICEDVVSMLKVPASYKEIEVSLEGDTLPLVYGHHDEVKQMLINLIDNGIKYSEKGSKVSVIKEYRDNMCVLKIKDTGFGIAKEHLPRLFERFYRIDKARSRSQGGTGLGLAIVKHIVLTMNGTIEVESEISKGSTFVVKIPEGKIKAD